MLFLKHHAIHFRPLLKEKRSKPLKVIWACQETNCDRLHQTEMLTTRLATQPILTTLLNCIRRSKNHSQFVLDACHSYVRHPSFCLQGLCWKFNFCVFIKKNLLIIFCKSSSRQSKFYPYIFVCVYQRQWHFLTFCKGMV